MFSLYTNVTLTELTTRSLYSSQDDESYPLFTNGIILILVLSIGLFYLAFSKTENIRYVEKVE